LKDLSGAVDFSEPKIPIVKTSAPPKPVSYALAACQRKDCG
jgi:hypothetical protein